MEQPQKRYLVQFEIDVYADSPKEACEQAWENLSAPDSMLPIGTVISENGEREDIDLSEDEEDDESVPESQYDEIDKF